MNNAFVRTFVPMKENVGHKEEERKLRREETRQLTLRYLALKECRNDVNDLEAEDHAAEIVQRVQQRLQQCGGSVSPGAEKECVEKESQITVKIK